MAEMDLGIREFSDDEKRVIWQRATSFRDWLVRERKKTLEEAREICRKCYDGDYRLLMQQDPYADFIWSRGDEVGDMEIDILMAIDRDQEARDNSEFHEHMSYWLKMEMTAESNVGKYPDEVWTRSREKFNEIMEVLTVLACRYEGKPLGSKAKCYLARVWRRLVELRHGKEPVLMWRHFALCRNALDQIRGIKRPLLKVSCPQDDGDDCMHDAMSLITDGVEVDLIPEEV